MLSYKKALVPVLGIASLLVFSSFNQLASGVRVAAPSDPQSSGGGMPSADSQPEKLIARGEHGGGSHGGSHSGGEGWSHHGGGGDWGRHAGEVRHYGGEWDSGSGGNVYIAPSNTNPNYYDDQNYYYEDGTYPYNYQYNTGY